MMILELPTELVVSIAECLNARGINALARTNRRLYQLLDPCLYRQDAQVFCSSALLWAAENGRPKTVRKALEAGANINAKAPPLEGPLPQDERFSYYTKWTLDDRGGRPPLSLAVGAGDVGMAALLLSVGGVDINLRSSVLGKSPLMVAVEAGDDNMTRLLLSANGIAPELKDSWGSTPLMLAAHRGYVAVVKVLLGHKDVHADTGSWIAKTPVWIASIFGNEEVVKLLLEAGASAKGKYDEEPLTIAASRGHGGVVKQLLATNTFEEDFLRGSVPSLRCSAAKEGYVQVFQELFAVDKSDPDWHTGDGRTSLWWAASGGYDDIVSLLLTVDGLDVNTITRHGLEPHIAAQAAEAGLGGWGNGITPLSIAAENGHLEVVKLLLGTGRVRVNTRDASDATALSAAESKGHENIVALLSRALK